MIRAWIIVWFLVLALPCRADETPPVQGAYEVVMVAEGDQTTDMLTRLRSETPAFIWARIVDDFKPHQVDRHLQGLLRDGKRILVCEATVSVGVTWRANGMVVGVTAAAVASGHEWRGEPGPKVASCSVSLPEGIWVLVRNGDELKEIHDGNTAELKKTEIDPDYKKHIPK